MKHYTESVIPPQPERTKKQLSHTSCDICNTPSKYPDCWTDGGFVGVLLPAREPEDGTHFPEDRDTETTELEICPTCFKERLIPWVKKLNKEMTEGN